jgi:hypothetical protein
LSRSRCQCIVAYFEGNPWRVSKYFTTELNLAKCVGNPDDPHGNSIFCLTGLHACKSYTVLMNAWPFEIGFTFGDKTWTFTTITNCFEECSVGKDRFDYLYRSSPVDCTFVRKDVITVRRVGWKLEFQRNGETFATDFKIFPKTKLFPCIYMKVKSDTVLLLDYPLDYD